MPIQTDTTISPYFDDFDQAQVRDYYKILFRPGAAVQVRELNQLQSILQKQIERFGDQVVKRGSVLDGCEPTYFTNVPYVKINDATSDGAAVIVSDYAGLLAEHELTGLKARIGKTVEGFESQDPDLNTLYLNYLNSGTTGDKETFANGQLLKVYSDDLPLYDVAISNSSIGFSNSDSVVILSAFEVQNTTGGLDFTASWVVGETITQATTGAQAQIVEIDTNANNEVVVIKAKPLSAQLAIQNTTSWSFARSEETTYQIVGGTSGNEGLLLEFAGGGATATVNTSATGEIRDIDIADGGTGYYVLPHVTVSSGGATESQINNLVFVAEDYIAKVTVAGDTFSDPVGEGYAMEITDGTVFQKGYFLQVDSQYSIVEKYSNTPDDVSVGFDTIESISNSSIDQNLLDNTAEFLNLNAPGANRLVLQPILTVKDKDDADEDPEFFPVWSFSQGKVYSTRGSTQFSDIGDEMAERTFEESGNYILDPFLINTSSRLDVAESAEFFNYLIDPGHGYINGYRVKTDRNYALKAEKANQTEKVSNTALDLVYGNYVVTNDFVGLHAFEAGQQISLRSAQGEFKRINIPGATIAAPGTELGKARIRSAVYDGGGDPQAPSARYRIYLFDVKMNTGKNFKDVKAVYSSEGSGGCADVIRTRLAGASGKDPSVDPSVGNAIVGAQLEDTQLNRLMVDTGHATANASNLSYLYRTQDTSLAVSTGGIISVNARVNASFPYTGSLTSTEEQDLIVIPEANLVSSSTLTGTYVSDSTGLLTGSGTSFTTQVETNDYLYLDDGVDQRVIRVTYVVSNTQLRFEGDDLTAIGGGATLSQCYPKHIPVSLNRSGRSASVTGSTLDIDLGISLSAPSLAAVTFNQRTDYAAPVSKTVNRKAYIKIDASTHPKTVNGPWCLGHADVFRLRKVYLGGTTSGADVTESFYIESGNKENYLDLAYLTKKPDINYTVGASEVLLVEFDVFTTPNSSQPGVKTCASYNVVDTLSLSGLDSSGTTINTMEFPEIFGRAQEYYDLRDQIDFRPKTVNTAILTTTEGSAPTNPAEASESTRFNGNDLLFPVPEGDLRLDYEYYTSRNDTIIVTSQGEFEVIEGELIDDANEPDNFLLYTATVPAYPTLPYVLSPEMREIVNTGMSSGGAFSNVRLTRYTVTTEAVEQQTPGYTMEEIEKLEKRISALEYYMNLSETENEIKDKNIPSSVDSTLERFKFGFFVDNFSDYEFTDVDSPEYDASVYQFKLHPTRKNLQIELIPTAADSIYSDGKKLRFPYTERSIVVQKNATDGRVIPPPPPPPPPPPVVVPPPAAPTVPTTPPPAPPTAPPAVVVEEVEERCVSRKNRNSKFNAKLDQGSPDSVFDQNIFKLSSNTTAEGDAITLFFDVYSGNDHFKVYQNTKASVSGASLLFTSSTVAPTALSGADRLKMKKTTGSTRWLTAKSATRAGVGNYWVKDAGKYSLTYDQSKGQYLIIQVWKGSPAHKYVLCYPAGRERTIYTSFTSITPPPVLPVTNPPPIRIVPPPPPRPPIVIPPPKIVVIPPKPPKPPRPPICYYPPRPIPPKRVVPPRPLPPIRVIPDLGIFRPPRTMPPVIAVPPPPRPPRPPVRVNPPPPSVPPSQPRPVPPKIARLPSREDLWISPSQSGFGRVTRRPVFSSITEPSRAPTRPVPVRTPPPPVVRSRRIPPKLPNKATAARIKATRIPSIGGASINRSVASRDIAKTRKISKNIIIPSIGNFGINIGF